VEPHSRTNIASPPWLIRGRAVSFRSIVVYGGFLFVLLTTFAARGASCEQMNDDALSHGGAIFAQRCSKCHGEQGQGISSIASIAGPSLQAENNPGVVLTAMEVGPSHMPIFTYVLSIQDMRAVAYYVTHQIAVIPLGGGDVSEGGHLFRTYCSTCHGTSVRGGVMAFTGVNAPALTTKSPALIAGAIRWGPGPMPSFPTSVLDDRQLDSIVKYVQFVQHPPHPGGDAIGFAGPVPEGLVACMIMLGLIGAAMWIERGGKG
jgi:ubiquinol-cytochrome c reductase cytochrome c subunit